MIHRGSAVRLSEHELRVAREVLDAMERAIECGTLEGDRIMREGRALRLDDGTTGQAGVVLELPPHDTGPFADREREMLLHIDDAQLIAEISELSPTDAIRTLIRTAREAIAICSSPRIRAPEEDEAVGAHYARLLACERSIASGGEAVSTFVVHPWGRVPGRQGGPSPSDPLEIDLPAVLYCWVRWDAIDTSITIAGTMHHETVIASEDPVATLRMTAELTALRKSSRAPDDRA